MSRKITSHIISGRLFRCSSSIRNELLLRYFSSAPIESPPPHQPELEITKTRVLSSIAGDKHVEYARGWAWQHVLLSHRLHARRQVKQEYDQEENIVHEDDDCILLLEHAPVYTLGRGATEDHLTFLADSLGNAKILERLSRRNRGPDSARLSIDRRAVTEEILQLPIEEAVDMLSSRVKPVLAPNGVPIYRVDRGGEVTFHGPSQLVVYPLVDLKRPPYQSDLHWYLRMVEEVVIRILKHYDIESVRDSINTGVWVGENKIAAIGVSASSWISTHGFALNVCPDLDYFDTSVILPCGIEGRGVTSIHKVLEERGEVLNRPTIEDVSQVALKCIKEVFDIQLDETDTSLLR